MINQIDTINALDAEARINGLYAVIAELCEALEALHRGREAFAEGYYDHNCPICGVNAKKIDDHLQKALARGREVLK